MFDGDTQTRRGAVELVSEARIQGANPPRGERSFAFLLGLRDTLYAWLAEVELELRVKLVEEPVGYFSEGMVGGEEYEEMVLGDSSTIELASFFEAVPFEPAAIDTVKPAGEIDGTEPVVPTDTSESAVASDVVESVGAIEATELAVEIEATEPVGPTDMLESAVATDKDSSVGETDKDELAAVTEATEPAVVTEAIESAGAIDAIDPAVLPDTDELVGAFDVLEPSLPVDTRQVVPSEWPTGMVPMDSGVGWRRVDDDETVRKQATANALEMLFRGGTLREVGRLALSRRRRGS